MKLKRLRYLMPFILTVIMLVSLVGWGVLGQSIKAVDDEDFRAKLTELNNDLIKLYPYIETETNSYLLESIEQSQRSISELTTEELAQIEEVFSIHPLALEGPKILLSIFEQIEMERNMVQGAAASCGSGLPGGVQDIYTAKEVALAAESALSFIPRDFVFGIIALGAGTVATVAAHPAYIPVKVAHVVAKVAVVTLENIHAVYDSCLQTNHRNLLEELATKISDIQYSLDNEVELRRVHLQVIELKEKQVFLVNATEAGIPIADVSLISAKASERDPVSFVDIEVTRWEMLADATGTYILEVNLPKDLKNASLFKFEVEHAPDPAVAHIGSVIFDRSTQNTITTGQ